MGSHKKQLKELIREYDLMEDEEMVEFAMEVYELGCKHGEKKAMSGFGERFDDDDDDEDEDIFREMWGMGGYGQRGGGGRSSGGSNRGGGSGGYGMRRGVRGSGRGRR